MIELNKPAPDFNLLNQDGTSISLGEFSGRWLVVYFYPKDDTPGCTEEACSFRDGYTELKAANVGVVGISKDSVASHKKFHAKFNLNFDILADPDHAVTELFGAWQEKSMFGKKYMGIQRLTVLINKDGVVRHVWPKVTPKNHASEILNVITSLSK